MTSKTVPGFTQKTGALNESTHRLGLCRDSSNGFVGADGFMRASSTGRYGKMEFITAPTR